MPTLLRFALIFEGITQKILALRSGLGESLVSEIVNGWRIPSEEQKHKIVTAFQKINTDNLFEDVDISPTSIAYRSLFSERELTPAEQARIDDEVKTAMQRVDQGIEAKKEISRKMAESTALKHFGRRN